MEDTVSKLNKEVQGMPAVELLRWAFAKFGDRVAVASSFGAEDVVLIDMLSRLRSDARIFTLDTGRLHPETYELMDRVRKKYNINILSYFPDSQRLERLLSEKGHYSFRESIESRKECCNIRKIEPLKRALAGMKAWVTGLRKGQSVTRTQLQVIEEGTVVPGIIKISPLAEWSEAQIWDYIRKNNVPYNALHNKGFPSIGCEPCTRAIRQGEDIRAGRWWWEKPECRECGLHEAEGRRHLASTSLFLDPPSRLTGCGTQDAKPEACTAVSQSDAEIKHLAALENRSIYIIREAYKKFKDVAMLWSIGKDSTVLLWLIKKAFFGRVPFPCVHCDTGYKFREIIEYRDRYAKEWSLNLIVGRNEAMLASGMGPEKGKFECCTMLKTNALQQVLDRYKFRALFVGIRRDEEGSRGKERYFSPRGKDFKWNYKEQPPELWDQFKTDFEDGTHIRIHPLLHWNEIDIWRYARHENIPMLSLYFSKDGKRYRSVGCECCCTPCDSGAMSIDDIINELKNTTVSERAGRAHDKAQAYMLQRLRKEGFM